MKVTLSLSQSAVGYRTFLKNIYRCRYLYLLMLPAVIYYIIFHYMPIYGVQIAFRDFDPYSGIWNSPWVGFKHFTSLFSSEYIFRLIKNTLGINLYSLLVGFPAPIILAIMLNEIRSNFIKRVVQTIVYLPHFISTVIIAGMLVSFLSPRSGIINAIIGYFGIKPINFLAEPAWFKTIYVFSDIWQNVGWGSIIYLAALTGIDPTFYEAATIDGAKKWQCMIHITLPCLVPIIITMFLLRTGGLFSIGFEKIMLLYRPITYPTADVISTYVYRYGLEGGNYSFATAVGLFNSIVNCLMLLLFNTLSRKLTETSLW